MTLFEKAQAGILSIGLPTHITDAALKNLQNWLEKEEFQPYQAQLQHCIESGYWDYLVDSFYQVIPFGTGGRRGEVGIGTNRINPWTLRASAQGHSQYLVKKYGEEAKKRGIVLAYDVRQFLGNVHLNPSLPSPIHGLTSRDLAMMCATIYAANGIQVYIFDEIRTTPQLSFSIRHLNAIAGDMFSASHNPPDHNGKKVYDLTGGMLTPPYDEELVNEVTFHVQEIQNMTFDEAITSGKIKILGTKTDAPYLEAAASISLSSSRSAKIAYTPLHGCGGTSVFPVLKNLGFDIHSDPRTSNPSGAFENITFNIPNPEVYQSFETTKIFADEINADIIISTDPDADRMGILIRHGGEWKFINGDALATLLVEYVIRKKLPTLSGKGVVAKTLVTTNIMTTICEKRGVEIIGNLLVGFKYIGDVMNELEKTGRIAEFLMGCEESHGFLTGNYSRDKDGCVGSVWFAELASELKDEGLTLIDHLDHIYAEYGYFGNHMTEIRLNGAVGNANIKRIQKSLRENPPASFGEFKVLTKEDCQNRLPIVSETDRMSKDVLVFTLALREGTQKIQLTVRPSGTEPKVKIYLEIGADPTGKTVAEQRDLVQKISHELERAVLRHCYSIIDVDFPERGFLLFWQLDLDTKLKYFTLEPEIITLSSIEDSSLREKKLLDLLRFLGKDPIEKIDLAFTEKYGKSVREYLQI